MRRKIVRGTALGLLVVLFGAVAAYADQVRSDVNSSGGGTGSVTTTAGSSATVKYWLHEAGACNAPLEITIGVPAGSGVTTNAPANTITLSSCGSASANFVSVAFSSSTPGSYSITHSFDPGGSGNAQNINQANFTLIVQASSNTAPTLTVPAGMTVEGNTTGGANVTYTGLSASDTQDGDLTSAIVCTPASGSFFALGGPVTVNCSVTDTGGLSDSDSFSVTVVDTTPPTLDGIPADITTTATGASSAVVSWTAPTATDIVDASPSVVCSPASGSTFPIGTTTVTCTATDASTNESSDTFDVTVVYAWTGFKQPVDNLPTLNRAKAGSAIPVKFSLSGDQGLSIFALGYPVSTNTPCGSTTTDTVESTVTAGNSSLSYDALADQYVYVWKTDKAWAGACRTLTVKLADNSIHQANFQLTK